MKLLLLAISAAVYSSVAAATSGNDLMRLCAESATENQHAQCIGYIDGATDGAQLAPDDWLDPVLRIAKNQPPPKPLFCIPQGVTLGQLRNVTLRWLQNNPARTHEPAVKLVIAAVGSAFPCR